MGKPKKGKQGRKGPRSYSAYNASNYLIAEEDERLASPVRKLDDEFDDDENGEQSCDDVSSTHRAAEGSQSRPNKHELYQRAVQKPKGDISYLQKFFLTYVGGRAPLHLREDFCGTALICAEWVRGDSRRTAVGLDLDEGFLHWGLNRNIKNAGPDAVERVALYCGNVVEPLSSAKLIRSDLQASIGSVTEQLSRVEKGDEGHDGARRSEVDNVTGGGTKSSLGAKSTVPEADIVCAFNYSCCCLHTRADLLKYFKQALEALSRAGGVFAMDLYGGLSSECPLKLRRNFDDFQYIWEQESFDVITRRTTISLHFRLKHNQGVLRHAFRYHWRMWTLPEVKDCLEEAGFDSVHFWVKEMPNLDGDHSEIDGTCTKYEEVEQYMQDEAWNAYVVATARPRQT